MGDPEKDAEVFVGYASLCAVDYLEFSRANPLKDVFGLSREMDNLTASIHGVRCEDGQVFLRQIGQQARDVPSIALDGTRNIDGRCLLPVVQEAQNPHVHWRKIDSAKLGTSLKLNAQINRQFKDHVGQMSFFHTAWVRYIVAPRNKTCKIVALSNQNPMYEMTKQRVFLGALISGAAFMVIMAVALILWRRLLWADVYINQGFFGFDSPSLLLLLSGLGTYFLVGTLFAMLYGHMRAVSQNVSTVRTAFMFGAIYWVSANLGYIGRVPLDNPGLFLLLEGVSDAVVFGLFALVLARVFKTESRTTEA